MSENKDKYHETILDLEEKLKKNVDLFLKIGNSLQAMFMLSPKPLVFLITIKTGLGYPNPYTLKQAISECPKLYVASRTGNIEIPLNVRDSEETLKDAFKSQQKMNEKMNNPISLHDELEQVKKKSLEIQEGLKARIKILEKDVQRCEKQVKLEDENVSLDFKVQSLIKERDNAKMEYKKLFDSIKKTRSQTQTEMDELIAHVSEKTYAYGAIRAENQNLLHTISELKARMKNGENGMNATSSVKGPKSRDSHVKTSVLDVSKNEAKKEAVYVRKNKQTDNTFAKVVSNKQNVIDVAVANASKAKTLLCVSCMQNVLIPCHDKCVAKHKLNVRSNAPPKTWFSEKATQSKTLDTTSVASKFKIDEESASKDRDKSHAQTNPSNTKPLVSVKKWIVKLPSCPFVVSSCVASSLDRSIDMAASSPICLMSKATSTKSWLWHRRLSRLNFGTKRSYQIDWVDGLPKFKYGKDHLCSACERGKSKKASHPPKLIPMDDFSRFTWVYFLRSKEETPEIIKKFTAQAQLNYKAKVCKIQTDNGTEFKNVTLKAYYEKVRCLNEYSSKEDLDNLFGLMFKDYFKQKSSDTSINSAA
ncbi:retrovirus-related pol polyprotein from transposon TNT 1-94 [Tanacetum coccineum]